MARDRLSLTYACVSRERTFLLYRVLNVTQPFRFPQTLLIRAGKLRFLVVYVSSLKRKILRLRMYVLIRNFIVRNRNRRYILQTFGGWHVSLKTMWRH